ncbi:cytochrome P450 4C1-like [Dermatophagoides pteronyssinus]|uniref:cytochrome P450 4C1-like n=1 Tax=Dermatophagoides pteronyssinus TaxID=6956 RepID=UPI003F6770EB
MILIIVFVFLVLIIHSFIEILQWLINQYRLYLMIRKIPGPKINSPFWGNINLLKRIIDKKPIGLQSKEFIDLMNRLCEQYDPNNSIGLIRLWFGPFVPIIIITNANIAQKLLNSKDHLDKATFYSLFRYAIKDGVFTSKTEKWLHQKREIQGHLKFKALQRYIANTERHLATLNERIDAVIDDVNKNGQIDDIKPILSTFVLDVLGENIFSTKFHSQSTGVEPKFVRSVNRMLELSYIPFLKPWSYYFNKSILVYLCNIGIFLKTLSHVNNFQHSVRKIILNRFEMRKYERKSRKQSSLLDTMIESRISPTNPNRILKLNQIETQINTFVVAGHDTTTSAISWTLYLLGHHPEQQQQLINEIDEFLANLNLNGESITLLSMRKLKYLESVILESLRLYPSGPFIARRSRSELQLNEQIILPENINYIIFIQHMHMNPEYFHEPKKFYPERFLRCRKETEFEWVNHQAYLPFSGGHRMCLGKEYGLMQQRMFLINIFRRYRVKSLDKFGDCQPRFNFLLSSAHFPIRFERRQPQSTPATPSFVTTKTKYSFL